MKIKKIIIGTLTCSAILNIYPINVSANFEGISTGLCNSNTGAKCIVFTRKWENYSSATKDTPVSFYHPKTGKIVSSTLGYFIDFIGVEYRVNASAFWSSSVRWIKTDPNGNIYTREDKNDPITSDEMLPGSNGKSKEIMTYVMNKYPGFSMTGLAIFGVDSIVGGGGGGGGTPPPRTTTPPGRPYDPPGRPTIPEDVPPPPADELNCIIGSVRESELSESVADKVDLEVSGTSALMGIVTPIKPVGFNNMSETEKLEWTKTHESQHKAPELTEFGKYLKDNWPSLRYSSTLSESEYSRLENRLRQLDGARYDLPEMELSENNKIGFQRGGAFTFTQMKQQMKLKAKKVTTKSLITECKVEYKKDRYGRTYRVSNWKASGIKANDPVIKDLQVESAALTSGGWTIDKSYQILNVRCNKEEFDNLVTRTGSTVLTEQGKTGHASSSAVSPTVNNTIATFFNGLSTDFYYNGKDCENNFLCRVIPLENGPKNEISNNVADKGTNDGTYGAQHINEKNPKDNKSTSSFKFFRDNSDKSMRLDIWFPGIENATNDFTYTPMSEPDRTYITLDPEGTPREDLFTLKDKDDKVIIDKKVPTDKYYSKWNKMMNVFKWNGAFASDDTKPHRMNTKFAYLLPVRVTTPRLAGGTIGNVDELDTEHLEFVCDTTFNSVAPTTPKVHNSPASSNVEVSKKFNDEENKFLEVRFLKAVTEE